MVVVFFIFKYRSTAEPFLPANSTKTCGVRGGKPLKNSRTPSNASMTATFGIGGLCLTFLVDDLLLIPIIISSVSNHANQIQLNGDIPQIVTDILKRGASLAIVSRNTSKALYVYFKIIRTTIRCLITICWPRCDRALYYFKAIDPESGEQKPIIEMVRYDEVVDGG